eukprot:3547566-Prymnesium_polylepis.1
MLIGHAAHPQANGNHSEKEETCAERERPVGKARRGADQHRDHSQKPARRDHQAARRREPTSLQPHTRQAVVRDFARQRTGRRLARGVASAQHCLVSHRRRQHNRYPGGLPSSSSRAVAEVDTLRETDGTWDNGREHAWTQ